MIPVSVRCDVQTALDWLCIAAIPALQTNCAATVRAWRYFRPPYLETVGASVPFERKATLESTLEPLFILRKYGHAINFYQEPEERSAHGRPGGRVMVKKLLVDLVKLLKAR